MEKKDVSLNDRKDCLCPPDLVISIDAQMNGYAHKCTHIHT